MNSAGKRIAPPGRAKAIAMVSPFSALPSARVVESESSVPSLYSLISFGSCISSD